MEELLTLKDIATHLGVPESNLRYYRNRIGDFLPSVGKGRRRRYFPEAEEIFRKTIEFVTEGVTLDRVYSIFAENNPLALREDIARPAQEELAGLIISKLREARELMIPEEASEPTENNSAIIVAIGRLHEDVKLLNERVEQLSTPQDQMVPAPAVDPDVIDVLQNKIATLEQQNQALLDDIAQKEVVLEGQKKALLDAREKRRQLTEELEQLRNKQAPPL